MVGPKESAMNPSDRNLRAVTLPPHWAPDSWRARTAMQMPTYPDGDALESALGDSRMSRTLRGLLHGRSMRSRGRRAGMNDAL